jgi:Tol biopolymer transport system component
VFSPRVISVFAAALVASAAVTARAGEDASSARAPSWKIVYTRNDGGLGVWTSTRRRLVTLTGVPGHDSGVSDAVPVWSPDGKSIAFNRDSGAPGIYAVRVGRERPRRLVKTFPYLSHPSIAWSPDRRRLAVSITCEPEEEPPGPCKTGPFGATALYAVDTDGSHLEQLVAVPSGDARAPVISGVVWSPDGRQIAYIVSDATGDSLYTISAEGGTPHLLATEGGQDRGLVAPTWSPNGGLIAYSDCAFARLGPAVYCDLLVGSSSGGTPRALFRAADTGLWPGAWLPTSTTLLLSLYTSTGPRLFAIDVASGRRRVVVRRFVDVIAVAGDGRMFAYIPETGRPAVATLAGRILDRGPSIPFFPGEGPPGSASVWIR